jgi:hypothetical protein
MGKRDKHKFFFRVEKQRGFGERKILKKKLRRQKGEHFERTRKRELRRKEKQSKNKGREDQRTRNRRKKKK